MQLLAGSFEKKSERPLRFAFILLEQFTLLPFAGFIDTLRLAADENDNSQQIHCTWTILGKPGQFITSSCGVKIQAWENYKTPECFDYIVVVGGRLKHGYSTATKEIHRYLQLAEKQQITLIGLCTGSFALIEAGLMNKRRCCVNWLHYQELVNQHKVVIPIIKQRYLDDGNIITCAGGIAAIDVAAMLIERHLNKQLAVKSLRIMIMDAFRKNTSPQPIHDEGIKNPNVRKVLLLLEQNITTPLSTEELASHINISKRQLERIFTQELGVSLQKFYRKARLHYGRWLLENTSKSAADVALECGFTDSSHFSRACKQAFK
ncbi:MAG: GlxA family transcriptional regulator [Coxiellaceae bacterium]|nr:GlxA family transcriptional regulator [Coxiellaceae bacterium]